jgi:SAM-dependent methyltransferase
MLTVDYDRLELQPGHLMLDLGCGFGRHAYEALRRGADVIACDLAHDELIEVGKISQAMRVDGEIDEGVSVSASQGDATSLPFPDATFDRIIASEVLEHIPADDAAFTELARILKPGGMLAITVPAFLPERICWALSDDYHAPAAQGGHVRIYTVAEIRSQIAAAGLDYHDRHHAHALHSPYWWLRCAVGPNAGIEDNRLVSAYHRLLSWDIISAPFVTRTAESILNPLIGKSLAVYATKPAAGEQTMNRIEHAYT